MPKVEILHYWRRHVNFPGVEVAEDPAQQRGEGRGGDAVAVVSPDVGDVDEALGRRGKEGVLSVEGVAKEVVVLVSRAAQVGGQVAR